MIAVVGLLCVGGGTYWKYGSTNEVFDMMARWGLNPHYAYAIGAIFLVLAVFTSVVGRRNARIDELETQLSIAEERWTGSDSVGERVGPAIESLGTTIEAMRSHVENLVGVLGGVESKVRTSERQSITIAASVDSLAAKVEEFQRTSGARATCRPWPTSSPRSCDCWIRSAETNIPAPRASSRRSRKCKDTLAAMEGRMRERMESMQSGKQSGEEVIAKVTSAMTQLREKLEAGLAQFPAQLSETFAPMPGHIERAEDGLGKKVNNVGEGLSKNSISLGMASRSASIWLARASRGNSRRRSTCLGNGWRTRRRPIASRS